MAYKNVLIIVTSELKPAAQELLKAFNSSGIEDSFSAEMSPDGVNVTHYVTNYGASTLSKFFIDTMSYIAGGGEITNAPEDTDMDLVNTALTSYNSYEVGDVDAALPTVDTSQIAVCVGGTPRKWLDSVGLSNISE